MCSYLNVRSKRVGGCILDYLSFINIVRLKFSTKIVCSKKVGDRFLVFSSLINIAHLKCVFKASVRLLLCLFIINQYCTPKAFFKKYVFKESGRLLSSLFILIHYCTPKIGVQSKQEDAFSLFITNQYFTPNVLL